MKEPHLAAEREVEERLRAVVQDAASRGVGPGTLAEPAGSTRACHGEAYDCETKRVRARTEGKMRNDTIEFMPLTRHIGAEVFGVDLCEPFDDETFRTLHGGLLEHLVLFFRDQDITFDQHVAFARRFGELHIHPLRPVRRRTSGTHEDPRRCDLTLRRGHGLAFRRELRRRAADGEHPAPVDGRRRSAATRCSRTCTQPTMPSPKP